MLLNIKEVTLKPLINDLNKTIVESHYESIIQNCLNLLIVCAFSYTEKKSDGLLPPSYGGADWPEYAPNGNQKTKKSKNMCKNI